MRIFLVDFIWLYGMCYQGVLDNWVLQTYCYFDRHISEHGNKSWWTSILGGTLSSHKPTSNLWAPGKKKSSDWVAKKSNVKLVFYHHGQEVSTLKSPPILQIAHKHMISLIVDGRGFQWYTTSPWHPLCCRGLLGFSFPSISGVKLE